MLVKDFLKVYDDLVLISVDDCIVADNKYVACSEEEFEQYLEQEIKKIEPFYKRRGIYAIGVIIEV